MDPKHLRFMDLAGQISQEKMRAGEGGPFGAIIVRDDKIIGQGWNQVTSQCDPSAHAEIVAIRNACSALGAFSLERANIYTSCEPCPMCLAAIWWARLESVYYANTRQDAARIGFDDAEIYREVGRNLADRQIPMIRCESRVAAFAFQDWTKKEDKIPY
jgi:tRNA(Arg) A34 adenosine deaminase TadA